MPITVCAGAGPRIHDGFNAVPSTRRMRNVLESNRQCRPERRPARDSAEEVVPLGDFRCRRKQRGAAVNGWMTRDSGGETIWLRGTTPGPEAKINLRCCAFESRRPAGHAIGPCLRLDIGNGWIMYSYRRISDSLHSILGIALQSAAEYVLVVFVNLDGHHGYAPSTLGVCDVGGSPAYHPHDEHLGHEARWCCIYWLLAVAKVGAHGMMLAREAQVGFVAHESYKATFSTEYTCTQRRRHR